MECSSRVVDLTPSSARIVTEALCSSPESREENWKNVDLSEENRERASTSGKEEPTEEEHPKIGLKGLKNKLKFFF